MVQFSLASAGYHVTVARNGRIARELADTKQFDLVVSDHQMPEITGIELFKELRSLPAYERVPFILLTAKGLELDLPR